MSFFSSSVYPTENHCFMERVRRLLSRAGVTGKFKLIPMRGGANNRVFRAQSETGAVLLKAYYHDPQDGRDRLHAEFAFSRFAWDGGLRCIPRPLADDQEAHLGTYEFIEGHSLRAADVNRIAVVQACRFYRGLNSRRFEAPAAALPLASEACFSLEEHLRCVSGRFYRLRDNCRGSSESDRRAREIVEGGMSKQWRRVCHDFLEQAARLGLDPRQRLSRNELRLSPSDFGFHNSLAAADGELKFFDFEYAGWDDPAKLICDFFCQPKLPVPRNCFDGFAAAVADDLSRPETMLLRVLLLMPLFRFKWCCIMLNEFVPLGARRRRYATASEDLESIKNEQLAKVRAMLGEVTDSNLH